MNKYLLLILLFPSIAFGATITRYVNTASSGGNGTTNATSGANAAYASLNAFESAEDGDLTDNGGDIMVVRCSGTTADTTPLTFDGWTTSDSCYVEVIGNSSSAEYDTEKYNLISDTPWEIIVIYTSHVRFKNIQVGFASSSSGGSAMYFATWNANPTTTTDWRVEGCVFRYRGSINANTGRVSIVNSLFISTELLLHTGAATMNNCTMYNGQIGHYSGVTTITNTVSTGFPWEDIYNYGGTLTLNYCVTSDGTGDDYGGTGNRVNQTVSFVDAANGDFHLSASDASCIDNGTSTGMPTTDIDGDTRSGSWDIGCDEYVSAAPPASTGDTFIPYYWRFGW